MTEPAAVFADLLNATMAQAHHLTREPTPAECPNHCALAAIEDAGEDVAGTDPLTEIAFWEYVAWAAEHLWGRQALNFARLCRALADDVLAGITVEDAA